MSPWSARPFLRYLLALIAGTVTYQLLPASAYGVGSMALGLPYLILIAVFAALYAKRYLTPLSGGVLIVLIIACTSYSNSFLHDNRTDTAHLLYVREPIIAYEAVVQIQPEQRKKSFRFELAVRRIRTRAGWRWAGGTVLAYLNRQAGERPTYGERWLVKGSPERVAGPQNPGQFDYRAFLATKQIFHRQYLTAENRQQIGYSPPSRFTAAAYQVNSWADSVLTHHIGTGQEFAIVKAMILGVRDSIDPDLQQAYSAAGAVHVLSVSGLHVGVLFWVLTLLFGFLRKRTYGEYAFVGLVSAILWFYALMTGFSAPVLRSVVMFSLILLAQVLKRRHDLLNTLAASAFLILLFDPSALFTAGFQLSYLAVGGLAVWQRPLYLAFTFKSRAANWLWEITSVALVAQLVTFPLGVFYFHQFPTYFWLVNPLVIPLSSLVLILAMLLLAVCWLPVVAVLVGLLLYYSMWLLNQVVEGTKALPYSVIEGLSFTGVELVLVLVLLACLVRMITHRQSHFIWPSLFISLLLSFSVLWATIARKKQQILVVHAGQKQLLLSLVKGEKASLLHFGKAALNDQAISFTVKGLWDSTGIRSSQVECLRLRDSLPVQARIWQGKTIVVLNKPLPKAYARFPAVIDYLIVTHNAVRSWEGLARRFTARTIIFDDSNSPRRMPRILSEARSSGFETIHWTRERGAFVSRIN